jgi:hypothetical protein
MSAQRERAQLTRSEQVRVSNERIAKRAVRLRFVSRVPMLCECSNPNCQAIILIGLTRYDELSGSGFLTAPSHTIEDGVTELREDGYWLQRVHGHDGPTLA